MSQTRIVVDRIEGDVAVLEVGGTTVDVPVAALPEGAREGSVLALTLQDSDSADMAARLERMQAKSNIGDDFTF